jgi:hypothetical protein
VHPHTTKALLSLDRVAVRRHAAPLAALYVLDRRDDVDAPRACPLAPGAALEALLTYSFVAEMVAALGLHARRFSCLARAVREVPVRRLSYRSGYERLDDACEAVLADMRA